MWVPSHKFSDIMYKNLPWIQCYSCMQFCCYYLIWDATFWIRKPPITLHQLKSKNSATDRKWCSAPSELLSIAKRPPQDIKCCTVVLQHSLACGGPLSVGLLFGRTFQVCFCFEPSFGPQLFGHGILCDKRCNTFIALQGVESDCYFCGKYDYFNVSIILCWV